MAQLKFQPLDKTDFILIVLATMANSFSSIAGFLVVFTMIGRAILRAKKT